MPKNTSADEDLKKLEGRLLEPDVRKSPNEVGALLADDFLEFASNGRIYDKAQIIEVLKNSPSPDSTLTDFKAVLLSPGVALATFRYSRGATKDRPAATSLRSSIWKKSGGRWLMVFHQGTLCGEK